MKIIYATDIHGDFEKLRSLLLETVADVYIIAGDLIDIPFYNMGASIRYHELQSYFHGMRRKMGAEAVLIEDFVDELLEDPHVSEEVQEMGTRYQQLTIRARRVMQQKYKVLKDIFFAKQTSPIYCLPGNYDMDLKFTSLHGNDLHLHCFIKEGLKICGYGGADVWTAGIPERYIVKYQAGRGASEKQNEMFRYFRAVRPDIIVAHQPAWGIHDRASYAGPVGSPSLRTYCDTNPVMLCLTGHAHHAWGVQFTGSTLYLNPSNFGEVTRVNGEVSEGGFFHQIEIEDRAVCKVIFRKISSGKIYDVADYYPKKGVWTEEVIDQERLVALINQRNYDTAVEKYSHIPEIELFNEIKKFFRAFQTPETEDRIDTLEEVARLLEEKIKGHIAMDVMGSVNMGVSQQGSDIDFVVYLRCKGACSECTGRCIQMEETENMIREVLADAYEFQILDCINLNTIEKSIREKNYECETTQRFVAYRSMCRPINYRVIAHIEDMLNQDMLFRKELEGSVQSYLKIFSSSSPHMMSLKKYEARLGAIGIKLPESIRKKIKQHLNGGSGE
ncbi:MAG: metallophosphoesterase [Desulfomonilia bacterium]